MKRWFLKPASRVRLNLKFASWSLQAKLVALVVAVSVVPLAAAGSFGIWRSVLATRADAEALLVIQAERLAGELDAANAFYAGAV